MGYSIVSQEIKHNRRTCLFSIQGKKKRKEQKIFHQEPDNYIGWIGSEYLDLHVFGLYSSSHFLNKRYTIHWSVDSRISKRMPKCPFCKKKKKREGTFTTSKGAIYYTLKYQDIAIKKSSKQKAWAQAKNLN